jgi:HEPN domain-containing protein
MSVELLIANFLRIAAEDLAGARSLSLTNNRNAIYLCEQAAEKVIRAVVTSEGKHAGIKHELAEMVDLIPDENPLKPELRAIEHLSQYATAYRYPVSSSKTKRIPRGPTPEELRSVLDATSAALSNAIQRFRVDMGRPDSPAGFAEPLR